MSKHILYIFMGLITSLSSARNTFNIKGELSGANDKTVVILIQYNFGETQIAKTIVNSEMFKFNNLDNLNDGVYSLRINYTSNELNNQTTTYQFDLILDKTESDIEIVFSPRTDHQLFIKKSLINRNYYQYLQLESQKINDIEKIKLTNELSKKDPLYPPTDFNDILEKLKQEVSDNKKKYIQNNFNKWSTAIIQNRTSLLEMDDVTKSRYWGLFQTNNDDLINTPIFQQSIQSYVVKYYNNADEEGYREAFQEIIKQFSQNPITKEWAIKYVITGLNQLGNKNLEAYFSDKYKYKI